MDPALRSPVPGVRLDADGGAFTVWAPEAREIALEVRLDEASTRWKRIGLDPASQGYFTTHVTGVRGGTRYRYRVDGEGPWPDPCSRFQPEGPHAASMVVDAAVFRWSDAAWKGVRMAGQVIYELHVGTFTPAGTFDAAQAELGELRDLGITVIELMPVAEFPGRFNWGYDGVALFAPYHGYGDADALRRFVDAAHRVGLGVILDVVYNHLGPVGNYLGKFSRHYFTRRYANEWGDAINFDGEQAHGVRAFFLENVRHWIEDYHLDGLRLDATQSIHDAGQPHILAEIVRTARGAAHGRDIIVTAENEPQQSGSLRPPERGGHGLDALWNDDFHHSARVLATGRRDGYLHDYRGSAQELLSAAKRGFLYQGQRYAWQKKRRGAPVGDQPAWSFITFLQNHDQVANTLEGRRLHDLTCTARVRALTALWLLSPQTPLLFMGQEFASSSPFPFFADHEGELRGSVHAGRRTFLAQFRAYATADAQALVYDPADDRTFRLAVLDFAERRTHAPMYRLHRDLLALRRDDPLISRQDRFALDGAVLGPCCLVLRWFGNEHAGDRLLLVSFGADADLSVVGEPLLAPPAGRDWVECWSSEAPTYGGVGGPPVLDADGSWRGPADQATLLVAEPLSGAAP